MTVDATDKARAETIMRRLRAAYPEARCSLDFTTPFQLLVATILSAQCTDERVNAVTATLFTKYPTVDAFADAPIAELEQDIRSTGFYRNKAKNVQAMARLVRDRFSGEVPRAMDDLVTLPGVARKTANVVQGNGFGIIEGVVVDTHVGRISRRLMLTTEDDPVKVERDLMAVLDPKDWLDYSHLLIAHGRAVCKAPTPICPGCVLLDLCPTGKERTGEV